MYLANKGIWLGSAISGQEGGNIWPGRENILPVRDKDPERQSGNMRGGGLMAISDHGGEDMAK